MSKREIWLSGGMMAALGALLGLREAGGWLTELARRAAGFAGVAAPRSLEWIAGTTGAQHLLAARDNVIALASGVLAIALAWRLARLLNPHGTLVASSVTGESSPSPRLQRPLDPPLLRRGFAAAVVSFYLFGGVRPWIDTEPLLAPPYTWGLSGMAFLSPQRPWIGLGAAFLLGGAALWLLWGEWGAVTPRQAPSSSRSGTLGRGLLVGAAAFPVLFPLSLWGRGPLAAVLAAVGLADPTPWRLSLWSMAVGLPIAFFALGLLGHALARPGAVPTALTRLSASLLILLAAGEAFFITAVATGRYDYGRDLASLVGASHRPSSARAFLIFPSSSTVGPLPGFVPYMSIQQIDAGQGSPQRTWQYLRRRSFQSASAENALVHLHDCASLKWDSAESLRVDLAALEHNPQPIFGRLLLQKLFTCATSAENYALLRQAAEPSRFRPDSRWLRILGLLYHRFGDHATALRLLRQAGLNPVELRKALQPEAPLTAGSVTGRLLVNGRPGAGLTAGVLPEGSWQTLVGAPHPYELRWVGAAAPTDADGRFHLRDLGEGSYLLIVMGDPAHLPLHPSGNRADTHPGLLRLDSAHPARDLGTIRIVTEGAPTASRASGVEVD